MAQPLTVRENGDIRIVDVSSDLGSYIATADLRKELETLIRKKNYKVIVNLSKVQHISSTAVGALVGISKRAQQKKGDLKIYGLSDNLKRTFDLVGASKVMEIYGSESDAVSSF